MYYVKTIFYFFLQNTLRENYFLTNFKFLTKFFVNGVPIVDRDLMQGVHGILGREL